MGNSQSVSSTRRDTVPQEQEVIADSTATDAIATSESTQAPAEKGEASSPPRGVGRPRFFMKFPSLRKKSRIGSGEEGNDDTAHGSHSSSRRRWRAFSSIKTRPVSTVADASAPVTDQEAPEAAPTPAPAVLPPNEKGKEREAQTVDEEPAQEEEAVNPSPESTENAPGPSLAPSTEDRGSTLSPDRVLRELHELQQTLSGGPDSPSSPPLDMQVEHNSDTRDQLDRAPTPVPTSSIDPTSTPPPSDAPGSGSHAALIEALGSWLGGRPRGENAEPVVNDSPVASGSRPWNASPSSSHRQPHNRRSDIYNEDLFARSSPHAGNPYGHLLSGAPQSASASRPGQNRPPASSQQERRPHPPTGTGTLVVVQGVVHTTDVRHALAHGPSTSPTGTPIHPPRSSSSTPTLRASTTPTASQPPSRASTPQPQPTSRRGRFSSLTSGLRQRSRPRTSSLLRNSGIGGWRHGFAGPGDTNRDETHSERSLGLGPGLSDSESGSASMSTEESASAPLSRDDASAEESVSEPSRLDSQGEEQNAPGEVPVPDEPPAPTGGDGGRATAETNASGRTSTNDGDGGSEDEGEAELSASSIEVLGTLLSVATAATAASLVTGTTDPLFSSGLAGPLANATANRSPTPAPQDSPTSNAPPAFTSMPSPSEDNNPEAAANHRMRAAWENLRERFSRTRGRRGGAGDGREDPREQMLREMARAFHMGLGLDPEGESERSPRDEERRNEVNERAAGEGAAVPDASPSPNEPTLAEGAGQTAPEPGSAGPGPEGSFERFLHNLQVDLRTALTEDYAARRARAQARSARAAGQSAAPSDSVATPDIPVEPVTAVVPPSEHTCEADSGERHGDALPLPTDEANATPEPSSPSLIPTVPNTPRPATLDLPSLPGDAESLRRDGFGPTPPQAHGITGQPGAGINWWRLYRFPPMQLTPQSTSGPSHTSTAGGVPATPRRASPEPPTASPTEAPVPPGDGHSNPRSPESSSSPRDSEVQNVVPVIVVGLQSVPVHGTGAHHHHDHLHEPPSPLGTPFATGPPSGDIPTRDRAWPLRAASRAFGRMGRRADAEPSTDSEFVPPAEPAGAGGMREGRHGGRTYLIFVIGGYYPPNHSIVTGADDMNSFEALWELAELLGQVKPPVASREDIEKSGLEIIQASSLSEYEKTGKVASNTVERCLICLDDYDPQDDLRLLSCRHIFHKQCVDKWLEQGRNNCPACRTKGVRTGDDQPTPAPTPSGVPSSNPLGNLD